MSEKNTRTEEFIRGLPKAELHVHIEGTLEPEMAFRLAQQHAVALPYASVAELRRAYEFPTCNPFWISTTPAPTCCARRMIFTS